MHPRGTTGIKKTGNGKLTVSGSGSYGGTNTIVAGTFAITAQTGLGSTLAPTIVSNGATLQIGTPLAQGEQAILNGNGVGNVGALRLTSSNPGNNAWTGGVLLGSDARINMDTSGTWGWATA